MSGGAKRVRPGEATVSGYATTIGLSAFLLFLIQPMIAKLLLPGGWTPIPSGGRYAASPSGGRITTGAAPSEGPVPGEIQGQAATGSWKSPPQCFLQMKFSILTGSEGLSLAVSAGVAPSSDACVRCVLK